jgi:hypothetical protein
MKMTNIAVAALLAGAAAPTGSMAGSAASNNEVLLAQAGEFTTCTAYYGGQMWNIVTHNNYDSCVAMARKCTGDPNLLDIRFYHSPVLIAAPYRRCEAYS